MPRVEVTTIRAHPTDVTQGQVAIHPEDPGHARRALERYRVDLERQRQDLELGNTARYANDVGFAPTQEAYTAPTIMENGEPDLPEYHYWQIEGVSPVDSDRLPEQHSTYCDPFTHKVYTPQLDEQLGIWVDNIFLSRAEYHAQYATPVDPTQVYDTMPTAMAPNYHYTGLQGGTG